MMGLLRSPWMRAGICSLVVFAIACSREAKPQPAIAVDDGAAAPTSAPAALPAPSDAGAKQVQAPGPAEVPLVRERRQLMSTIYEITVVSSEDAKVHEAIARALAEVERLERELSEWIPESDVSRVNAAAGKEPVKVGPDTLENIRASLDAAKRTGGAFDPTWGALRPFYLFQPGRRKRPTWPRCSNKSTW